MSSSQSADQATPIPNKSLLPRYSKNARVVLPTDTEVPIATGSNKYLSVIPAYLARLRASASSVADPAEMEEFITDPASNLATGHATV